MFNSTRAHTSFLAAALVAGLTINHAVSTSSVRYDVLAVWKRMDRAFVLGDRKLIRQYVNEDNAQLHLYAQSLLAAKKLHFEAAIDLATHCTNERTPTDESKFLHLVCIIATASYYNFQYDAKKHFELTYQAGAYARANKAAIAHIFGSRATSTYLASIDNSLRSAARWPDVKVHLNTSWKSIALNHGTLDASTDEGARLHLKIDTGSSGIFLTYSDALASGALAGFEDLGVTVEFKGYDASYGAALYMVKGLRIGPLSIQNAIVAVGPPGASRTHVHSVVGLNVLRKFGNVIVFRDRLVHETGDRGVCRPMMVINYGIANAWWGIASRIDTDFGDGVYYIDTGFGTDAPRASLFLFSKYGKTLLDEGRIDDLKRYVVDRFDPGGAVLRGTQVAFEYHIGHNGNKRSLVGYVLDKNFKKYNPLFDGVIGLFTVQQLNVGLGLDYERRRVCLVSTD